MASACYPFCLCATGSSSLPTPPACSYSADKDTAVEALKDIISELELEVGRGGGPPARDGTTPLRATRHALGVRPSFGLSERPFTHQRHVDVDPALCPTSPPQDLPLYLAGVSSGATFALKLLKDLRGELDVSGVICEVLAIDPDKDSYNVSWGGRAGWLDACVVVMAVWVGQYVWLGVAGAPAWTVLVVDSVSA